MPPKAGEVIDAVGAALTVNGALVCELDPGWFVAVTALAYCPGELATIELDVAPDIGALSRVQL